MENYDLHISDEITRDDTKRNMLLQYVNDHLRVLLELYLYIFILSQGQYGEHLLSLAISYFSKNERIDSLKYGGLGSFELIQVLIKPKYTKKTIELLSTSL